MFMSYIHSSKEGYYTAMSSIDKKHLSQKMALLVAQFIVLMAGIAAGRLVNVIPDPSNMLQQLLCNSSTDFNDTTLLLSTSGVHTIYPNVSLCLIQYASNFTITVEPLSTSPATIHCLMDGTATSGLALAFGSEITISNVVFQNCGEKVSKFGTGSSFHQSTRAALLITSSKDVILSKVTIYSWFGYGLLCINLAGQSFFNSLTVTNGNLQNSTRSQSIGSGVAIVYNQDIHADSIVQVTNSSFYDNQDYIDYILPDWKTTSLDTPGAGGLTVLVQNTSTAMINVTVSNSIFTRNTGPVAGGAALLVHDSSSLLYLLFQGCVFDANFGSTKAGSGFSAYLNDASCIGCTELDNTSLSFRDTIFRNHFDANHGSGIFISSSRKTSVLLQNITCYNNSAIVNGHCIYAASSSPTTNMVIDIENMQVTYNGQSQVDKSKAVLVFINISSVSIKGSGFSANNNYGSVFYCLLSNLYLSGVLEFNHNTAMYGPAIYLDSNSFVHLSQLLSASFNNNTADVNGGAIYAVPQPGNKCAIQMDTKISNRSDSVGLYFMNNKANLNGQAIFANSLYNCTQEDGDHEYLMQLNEISTVNSSNSPPQLASIPEKMCWCNKELDCSGRRRTVSVFPGQPFSLAVATVDAAGNTLFSLVTSTLTTPSLGLPLHMRVQRTLGTGCSQLDYTILSNTTELITTMTIRAESKKDASLEIEVHLMKCPLGFELTHNGECACGNALSNRGVVCNKTTGLINLSYEPWFGQYGTSNLTALTTTCPLGRCTYTITFVRTVNLSEPNGICAGKRIDVVCGQCPQNYSVVFGDEICLECSNYYILLLPVFGFAGILLVFVLYTLKLTISGGTVNGYIFTLNLLGITTRFTFSSVPAYVAPIYVVLSITNLDLGFPLCFFDGMTEIGKAGLRFIFPFYLFVLVGTIVFISRYSSKLAKATSKYSVQVLTTLIYLSYSKIVNATLFVVEFHALFLSNGETTFVWFGDGQSYFENHKHLILLVIAFITCTLFTLPYTIGLTVAPFLLKYKVVNQFKPFLDAHFGPYQDKYRYWFAIRLWVIIIINVLNAGLRQNYSIFIMCQIIVVLTLIITEVSIKPYKNKYLNYLDAMMLSTYSLSLLTVLSAYFFLQGAARTATVATTDLQTSIGNRFVFPLFAMQIVFAFIAVIIFLCILGYHIYKATNFKKLCYRKKMLNEENQTEFIEMAADMISQAPI